MTTKKKAAKKSPTKSTAKKQPAKKAAPRRRVSSLEAQLKLNADRAAGL